MTPRSLTTVFLLATQLAAAAPPKPLESSWGGLRDWVGPECSMRLTLTDRTVLEGTLLAVGADTLSLFAKRTSNPKAWSKGDQILARRSISRVEVRRERTAGRKAGLWTGVAIGTLLGAVSVAVGDKPSGGMEKAAVAAIGIPLSAAMFGGVGYAIGRSANYEEYRAVNIR